MIGLISTSKLSYVTAKPTGDVMNFLIIRDKWRPLWMTCLYSKLANQGKSQSRDNCYSKINIPSDLKHRISSLVEKWICSLLFKCIKRLMNLLSLIRSSHCWSERSLKVRINLLLWVLLFIKNLISNFRLLRRIKLPDNTCWYMMSGLMAQTSIDRC